jgi:uncharacterized protein
MNAHNPWYRHRWPWILIAGPAVVIVASFVTLWIAMGRDDALVMGDYYKQGLAINEDLARVRVAAGLGLSATLRSTPRTWDLTLGARDGVRLPARLNLTLSHATRQDLDQTVTLAQQPSGHYEGVRRELANGRWELLLEDADRTWRLAATLRLPGAEAVAFESRKIPAAP